MTSILLTSADADSSPVNGWNTFGARTSCRIFVLNVDEREMRYLTSIGSDAAFLQFSFV
jgi:hypothetical protein